MLKKKQEQKKLDKLNQLLYTLGAHMSEIASICEYEAVTMPMMSGRRLHEHFSAFTKIHQEMVNLLKR